MSTTDKIVLIDGSRIIIEALARAGADVFIGYPITPANWLYAYARQRFPQFLAAPDEITALQWAAGFSATGKLPVTATSFPGFALMVETLNMLYMMELPVAIVLAQRLGPSTGSATTGAQGDLLLLRGVISGGYPLPVFCPSNFVDCWHLAAQSLKVAKILRTPVVLLTSKEMVMTHRSFRLSELPQIFRIESSPFEEDGEYLPYQPDEQLVPPFLPVGNEKFQVRLNASTHDATGLIRKATPEAMANTRRLQNKLLIHLPEFTFYDLDDDGSDILVVTYGISTDAAREALKMLRSQKQKVSLLILKTLFPLPAEILNLIQRFKCLVIVEENLNGLLREVLFGQRPVANVVQVNKIGSMITPREIVQEIEKCRQVF